MDENLKLKKKQKLRNNEYYSMQDIYDDLYNASLKGRTFKNLMELIKDERNISLAYRNIKKNKGSKTPGTDGLTIKDIEKIERNELIGNLQKQLDNYYPKSVRRKEIPKPNGKTRPLGIPCIKDRIIQQSIKQVLEPICEAKFHKHSYGFRPNRSTDHAIARTLSIINFKKTHFVVDIDIKGFFDNVNHSKLKKQMWNLGIQDKNLITVIGKILNSEIEGIGKQNKGTPQGGIISPLLSNIVLNELDWWLSSQWETQKLSKDYSRPRVTPKGKPYVDYSHVYSTMRRKTKLKEFWFVRYADDFKIFCKDYTTAVKIYNATKQWLEERLGLEISQEKSKITNLNKNYSEFLGFKLKVKKKKNKKVVQSKMSNKAKINTLNKILKQIRAIQHDATVKNVMGFNSLVLGSHNYYKTATDVSLDFSDINFLAIRALNNRLRNVISHKNRELSESYKRLYGDYLNRRSAKTVCGLTLFPIYGVKNKPPMCFNQDINNYTEKGRAIVHSNLKNVDKLIRQLLGNYAINDSVELADNKISLIAGQKGKCYISKENLTIGDMECHHKKPRSLGGTDEYKNLIWVKKDIHKLIHCDVQETINKYMEKLKLNAEGLKKVNSLRKLVGKPNIII